MDRWSEWKDKRVYLELNSGRKYTGIIIDIESIPNKKYFITIKDKFNKTVSIINTEILLIQEED